MDDALQQLAALVQSHDSSLIGESFLVGGYAVIDYLDGFDDIEGRVSTEDIDLVVVGKRQAEWRTILLRAGWTGDEVYPFRYMGPQGEKIDLLALNTEQTSKATLERVPPVDNLEIIESEYYIVLAKAIWHEGLDNNLWPQHMVEGMRGRQAAIDGWWRLNGFGIFLTKLAAITCSINWLSGAMHQPRIQAAQSRLPRDTQDLCAVIESFRAQDYLRKSIEFLNKEGQARIQSNYQMIKCFCESRSSKERHPTEVALVESVYAALHLA